MLSLSQQQSTVRDFTISNQTKIDSRLTKNIDSTPTVVHKCPSLTLVIT